MRPNLGDLVKCDTRLGHQADFHAGESLVHDMQSGFGQKAVNVGDTAIGRIFDRQHRQFGLARDCRVNHVFKGPAGQGLEVRS